MLNAYLTATNQLLQNPPSAAVPLYSTADVTSYINKARQQLAGDSECVRAIGTLTLTADQRTYPFSSITIANAATLGIAGIFNARIVMCVVGAETDDVNAGQIWVRPRPWPWFVQYRLNNAAPPSARPNEWTQYGQGSTGSLYLDPIPDTLPGGTSYTLNIDCVCLPALLAVDTDPEAIPYPFTDAVPFFAAYYAMLSAQSAARQADADRMFARYEEFRNRARKMSNPTVLPYIYEQSGNPVRANQLGIQSGGQG